MMGIIVHDDLTTSYRCDEHGCKSVLDLLYEQNKQVAVEAGWFFERRRTLCPRHAPKDSMLYVKRNRYGRPVIWYSDNASHVFYMQPMEIMQLAERIMRQVVIPVSREPGTFSLLEDEA